MSSDELNTIIERIASGTQTATDVEALRVALSDRNQDNSLLDISFDSEQ